jgi:LmbE family N-acetylglucosaminyl deacetylase
MAAMLNKPHQMKKIRKAGIVIILLGICIVTAHILYLYSLKPKENYPEDSYLQNPQNKTALIIVAHDDDAAPFSGTTSLLAAHDWDIIFMCFYTSYWRPEEKPVRKLEMEEAAKIQGFKHLELVDFTLRNRLDTVKQPWRPVPYDRFTDNFKIDSLNVYILDAIERYRPNVIFTLDNVIGAYGHPEHVLVSQSITEICSLYKDSLNFPVKKIYQSVLPHSLAEKIMGHMDVYSEGKRIYGCNGIPSPDVQINISAFAISKKKVFLAHASQHRNLKKFIPYYHYYPGWLYFGIFNKEYFRIIDIDP